jgi:AcrR family transcriptional regulator
MSLETSRDAFLEALETLLSVPDAVEPGINAVARQAGLNKVLLYRYFGSWDGFLDTFARRVNPWRDLRIEVESGLASGRWITLTDVVKWLFRAYLDRLAGSPLLQNLLRLSIVQRNPLQAALERDRETEGLALMAAVGARFPLAPGADPAAMTALVTGGLTWLVLVGTRAGAFNGLTFSGPEADAQARLVAAVDAWADTLTKPPMTASL